MNAIYRFFDWLYICFLKQVRPNDPQGAPLWQRQRCLRNEILHYYKENPTKEESILAALDYLQHRPDAVYFPGLFRDKYKFRDIDLGMDGDGTFYWDMKDHKRLFFIAGKPDNVRMSINDLLIEQDEHSPHRYLTPEFCPGPDDVLADVGSAEGILSLQLVDHVKQVYLFESDPAWAAILHKTFAPWKEKVKIVSKFVSDKDDDNNVRLDTFFKQEGVRPTFVKLDVEGGEMDVLHGMEGLLKDNAPMKIAACSYHLYDEYENITSYAREKGFRYETSEGWMLFGLYDTCRPPYFRHGLVRMWTGEKGLKTNEQTLER